PFPPPHGTPPPDTYSLSLHDALPICPSRAILSMNNPCPPSPSVSPVDATAIQPTTTSGGPEAGLDSAPASCAIRSASEIRVSTIDRKSTRLNSSHVSISYAVFCLKKK